MIKVLLVRFSSIGDVVLTTPVIRTLKAARPDWEIHYLTKAGYVGLLAHHPDLTRVHVLGEDFGACVAALRAEGFTYLLDLHHNLRSLRLKLALGIPSAALRKYNRQKYWLVRTKRLRQPIPHIVTRYEDTLRFLGITPTGGPLALHLPPGLSDWANKTLLDAGFAGGRPPLAVVLGATHRTKRWLPAHFRTLLNRYGRPVLLLGGPDARAEADTLLAGLAPPAFDAVGHYDLLAAAALMQQAQAVLTHDTGFMHIAAAFGQPVYSLWGSTVPALGMTPWRTPHRLLEHPDLSCRPCSKIGHDRCPRGHFRCMTELSPERVLAALVAGLGDAEK